LVERSIDVTPGASSVVVVRALPVGQVTFTADAFDTPCQDVTADSVPTWTGDAVVASIVSKSITDITIKLRRNGRANVTLDFDDEDGPTCGEPGVSCASGADCCAGTCTAGVCTAGAPGGANCSPATTGAPSLALNQVATVSSPCSPCSPCPRLATTAFA